MSTGGIGTTESYLRVAATSIYGYDLLVTLPKSRHLWSIQAERPSLICCCYFALIFFTVFFLIAGQTAYFDTDFGSLCSAWAKVLAATRVAASLLAKLTILWRTLKIWPNRYLAASLCAVLLAQFGIALYTVSKAVPRSLPGLSNCIATAGPSPLPAWNDFLLNVIFDGSCWLATVIKLVKNHGGAKWRTFSKFLLRQSSGYMAAQTLINVGNLVFFALPFRLGLTTTLSSLGLAFGSILAQRMVTGLHDYKVENPSLATVMPTLPKNRAADRESIDSNVFGREVHVDEAATWWRKEDGQG